MQREDMVSPAFLTVGVTGHRDLRPSDRDRFAESVKQILDSITAELPHTRVLFVTGLAEGSDQIAAEVAQSYPNVNVIAALPMGIDTYRKDFTGMALENFERALSRSDQVIEVLPNIDHLDPDVPSDRDVCYQHLGRWLARNCHVLIAAWDGSEPELIGGTADNVYFKAEGLSPLPTSLPDTDVSLPDHGLILWCPVGRRSSENLESLPEGIQVLSAGGATEPWNGSVHGDLSTFEAFNSQTQVATDAVSCTERLFESADRLASMLQKRYQRVLITIMVAGVLALASIDALQTTGSLVFIVSTVLSLATSVSLWIWLSRSGLRDRFQQARALAEGARIQVVWHASNIEPGPADSFLAGQSAEVEWIRSTLRAAWLMDGGGEPRSGSSDFSVAKRWFDDQISYFQGADERPGAIRRTWAKQTSLRRRATAMLAIAAVALGADVSLIAVDASIDPWVVQVLRLVWSIGLGVGVAIVSYSELMGFGQLSQRYALTVPYLTQGREDLQRAEAVGSDAAARRAVRTAGSEALREAGDWLALHSHRQVRPV